MSMRVMILARDEGYRDRLAARLGRAPGVSVVQGSSPGTEAPVRTVDRQLDAVVVHVEPPLDGQLDCCNAIASLSPRPLVVVLGRLGRGDTERAEASGADAVVSPAVGTRHLVHLLRVLVTRPETIVDREHGSPAAVPPAAVPPGLPRRRFLGGAAASLAGAAGLAVLQTAPASAEEGDAVPPNTTLELPDDEDAILVRMQQDLQRALRKPIEERRWGMMIDLRKCIGCSACTVACVAENHLPPGVVYRPVTELEVGLYPNVARQFLPRPCMQCDDPPCTDVCPVAATYKRPDGVVEIDYEKCIGCRYCIPACPYGARTFDWGESWTGGTPSTQEYETTPPPEYGGRWGERSDNDSPIGNVRKCHFCLHRLNAGMLPACTTTCVGAATYFGDLNDPESLVAQLIGSEHVERLREDKGTEPKVFYLR